MNRYKAPWSLTLHVVSWTTTAICLIAAAAGAGALRQYGQVSLPFSPGLIPLVLIAVSALFTVRGYVITPDAILVQRLFWNTALNRRDLVSVAVDPTALQQSLRTCGNGGLFSFTGFYWNTRLRSFRAFVTDPRLCVVLTFSKRTVVVSPDYPVSFCQTLRTDNEEPEPLSPAINSHATS